MGPEVPSLAVFFLHIHMAGVFIKPALCFVLQALAAECFSCFAVLSFPSWSAGCVASLHALLRRQSRCLFLLFAPILVSVRRFSRERCFFSLDYDILVVIVHVVLLSCCHFSSGLFLQLHLVVVYSDVACWWSLLHYCFVFLLWRCRWTCASAVVYHNLVCSV